MGLRGDLGVLWRLMQVSRRVEVAGGGERHGVGGVHHGRIQQVGSGRGRQSRRYWRVEVNSVRKYGIKIVD